MVIPLDSHINLHRMFDNIKALLESAVKKLVTDDYIFLDLPYYPNVGDVMIWEATLQLLKGIQYHCLYSCSVETYRKPHIKKSTILLFSGGGNFGDLWEKHQRFRHKVMADFPENPVVQLPQSVWFEDKRKMYDDIQFYQNHKAQITICLRDQQSFNIISKNYPNVEPFLLPDLALALDIKKVLKRNNIRFQEGAGFLYFRRDDKEYVERDFNMSFDAEGDWPCRKQTLKWVHRLQKIMVRLERMHIPVHERLKFHNFCYRYFIKNAYLCNGIQYLMPYKTIYASRLHAAVLGVLLGKQVFMIDNSYHKCSEVYNLWMNDLPNIRMI